MKSPPSQPHAALHAAADAPPDDAPDVVPRAPSCTRRTGLRQGLLGIGSLGLLAAGAGLPLARLAAQGQDGTQPSTAPGSSATGSPSATAPVTTAPTLGDILGVCTKFRQGQRQADLALVEDLGVRWVREEIYWADLEPRAGSLQPLWPATLERLRFYRQRGIGVVMLLYGGNPAWGDLKTQPLRHLDPAGFGRFAAHVAAQLQALGLRFVIEVWNEPHNTLKPALGGQWNGRPPSPWLDHYLRIVAETTRQVHAVDPAITVVSSDDMWVLHHWFLEGGLPRDLDGFAVHPYAPRGPERTAVDFNTEWTRPFELVDQASSFASAMRLLRDKGRARLDREPGLWITEWGWALGSDSPYGKVSEEILAALLPRCFVLAHAAGARALTWFSLQDNVDGPMGLTSNRGEQRLPYAALRSLARQLGPCALVRQVQGVDRPTRGVQAFLYRSTQPAAGAVPDHRLVAWTVDGSTPELTVPLTASPGAAPGAAPRVQDLLGRTVVPQRSSPDQVQVRLGLMPVVVTGVDAAALTSAAVPRPA